MSKIKEAIEKPENMEFICVKVHKAYCDERIRQGKEPYWTAGDYSRLDEATKEYDRATVRAVVQALALLRPLVEEPEAGGLWQKGNNPKESGWYLVKYLSNDKPPNLLYEKLWFNPDATPHWWYQTGYHSMFWSWPDNITYFADFNKLCDIIDRQAQTIKDQAAENAKLNLILYHRENGLSHPDLNNEILQSRLAEAENNLKVKDELLEWAWVDCGSQDDLTGYLAHLEEMNKPSES